MSLGTIILILLILMLVGALPSWPHSASWGGLFPVGSLGKILISCSFLFCWAGYSRGEARATTFIAACSCALARRPDQRRLKCEAFHQARANESRLRVVFRDDQVSFGFPASATLGDVADWVADVARFRHDAVIAIAVTMPALANSSIVSIGVVQRTH